VLTKDYILTSFFFQLLFLHVCFEKLIETLGCVFIWTYEIQFLVYGIVTLNSSLRPYCRTIRLKLEILTYVNRNSTAKFKGFRAKMSAFVTFDSP